MIGELGYKIRTSFSNKQQLAEQSANRINSLATICSHLLDNKTYSITPAKAMENFESATKLINTNSKSIRLKITLHDKNARLSDVQIEEIELKLMHELKSQLGEGHYNNLLLSSGVIEEGSYYFIDISEHELSKLAHQLKQIERALRSENDEQSSNRQKEFEHRKLDKEIEKLKNEVKVAESQFGPIPTNSPFGKSISGGSSSYSESPSSNKRYSLRLTNNLLERELKLGVAEGRKEFFIAVSDDMPIPTDVKNSLLTMYLIIICYKVALRSDTQFQEALLQKYPGRTIDEITSDSHRRNVCFSTYIERHADHRKTITEIFNSLHPDVNRHKAEIYTDRAKSITAIQTNANMNLAGAIAEAINYCHCYIETKEKEYIEPMRRLIDASHFMLGYPQLRYVPQFEQFNSNGETVSGSLQSIKLEVISCANGPIQTQSDFDSWLNQLQDLLGHEKFQRLVLSYETISSMCDGGTTYFLFLNPVELQTITLAELLPRLSVDDMKMYNEMCNEKIKEDTGNEGRYGKVNTQHKDWLAMYEIYARFKMTTLEANTKVEFTSDPAFHTKKGDGNEQARFIQFVKGNANALKIILEIFPSTKLSDNEAKRDQYVSQSQIEAKLSVGGNLLKKNWYTSFSELVKCCMTIANKQHFINFYVSRFLMLLEFKSKPLPLEIIYDIFKDLILLNAAVNQAETKVENTATNKSLKNS